MKQGILFLIRCYQHIVSPLLKHLLGVSSMCKYSPSCSEYTRRMIAQFGVVRGSWLGIERLVSCR